MAKWYNSPVAIIGLLVVGYMVWQGGYLSSGMPGVGGGGVAGGTGQVRSCEIAVANTYDSRDALNPATALTETYSFYQADGTNSPYTTASTNGQSGVPLTYVVAAPAYYNASGSFMTACGGQDVAPRQIRNGNLTLNLINSDGVTANTITGAAGAGIQAIGTGGSAQMRFLVQESDARSEFGSRECLSRTGYGYYITIVSNNSFDANGFNVASISGVQVDRLSATPVNINSTVNGTILTSPWQVTWGVKSVLGDSQEQDFVITVKAASTIDPTGWFGGTPGIRVDDCALWQDTISNKVNAGPVNNQNQDVGTASQAASWREIGIR